MDPSPRHSPRSAYRGHVHVDRVLDLFGVPTAHDDGDGDAGGGAEVEEEAVAFGEGLFADVHPPELVAGEGVGAGDVDRDLRVDRSERAADPGLDGGEEDFVARPVGERQVQVARLLLEWVILLSMDREGEDR